MASAEMADIDFAISRTDDSSISTTSELLS